MPFACENFTTAWVPACVEPLRTRKVRSCRTFVKWSFEIEDDGAVRTVRMVTPWDPRLQVDFSYSCDCPDFISKPGPCVHVLVARGHHCAWHEVFDPEPLKDSSRCPRCGGPTTEVAYTPE